MNDVIIFAMGCVVSLAVLGAVSLLLWGAANEPHGELPGFPDDTEPEGTRRESGRSGELKSPA